MKLHQLLQAVQFETHVCIIHGNCEYTVLHDFPINNTLIKFDNYNVANIFVKSNILHIEVEK